MHSPRELVFGPMPMGATPQTHIATGPWCFSGQEGLFPGWWTADAPLVAGEAAAPQGEAMGPGFALPPDPFSAPDESPCDRGKSPCPLPSSPSGIPATMPETARAANAELVRLTGLFAQELSRAAGEQHSDAFWEMALGPWLLLAVHMLAERQKRVLDLVALYGQEQLIVPVLPALPEGISFEFQSVQDFMVRGVLDRDFNHYVFSRIAEAVAPKQWKLCSLPALPSGLAGARPAKATLPTLSSLRNQAKTRLAALLRDLPFPLQKGFSLPFCAGLSLAVLLNRFRPAEPDHSTPFAAYGSEPLPWVFDAPDLVRRTMPRPLRGPYPAIPHSRNRLRGMTAAISQDDAYRLRLAAWREGGGRLFSVQHGANYGNLRCMGGSLFEYAQHAFITWGWKQHTGFPLRAVPLPHPALAALHAEGHRRKKQRLAHPRGNACDRGTLVLVGTEISPYSYRLKSRPLARQQVLYRSGKVDFLRALPPEIAGNTLYRPYFAVPGGLEDRDFVQAQIPNIRPCAGDLLPHLQRCRLLALDHYGTTMLQAYAADIPTLCFWNRREWAMEPQTEALLHVLAGAGMLYEHPAEAAAKVARVWNSVEEWWYGPKVQEARARFCDQFARGPASAGQSRLFACWFRGLMKI